MEIHLTEHLTDFVNRKVREGGYENASEVVRDALRKFEIAARAGASSWLPGGFATVDIEELISVVMREAYESAQEDLRAIMAEIKAASAAKKKLRCLMAKIKRDVVKNAGRVDGRPALDFSTGLGSEEAYHKAKMPVPDTQAVDSVTYVQIDLWPGVIDSVNQLAAIVDTIKNKLDSLSELGEMESIRLQMAMDRRSKMMATLSNLMKKISETNSSITQNIK